jgi:hypothetical protein
LTRARYLGNLDHRRVFTDGGEARPTILLDGQVIATWSYMEKNGLRYEPLRTFPRWVSTAIEDRLHRLANDFAFEDVGATCEEPGHQG